MPRPIDEVHEARARLPAQCPACRGPVGETGVAHQYQEALPVARVIVRQFNVHVGRCGDCGRRVQGRHALQTSDAFGAAAAPLGAQVIALVVVLNKQLGLSFGKIAAPLQPLYGLTVTRSGLVHAVHRAARQAQPTRDREAFRDVSETELLGLHEGNFARYAIRPAELAAWRHVWSARGA